jgi:hypothetical protein
MGTLQLPLAALGAGPGRVAALGAGDGRVAMSTHAGGADESIRVHEHVLSIQTHPWRGSRVLQDFALIDLERKIDGLACLRLAGPGELIHLTWPFDCKP